MFWKEDKSKNHCLKIIFELGKSEVIIDYGGKFL